MAEIRPVTPPADDALEQRVRDLTDRGAISGADGQPLRLRPVAKRRGALRRFLADRE